jgi:hypothetical protein
MTLLYIQFSHMKNDQGGPKNFNPYHCYANSEGYSVRQLAAIFEYLCCSPDIPQDSDSLLLPGSEHDTGSRRYQSGFWKNTKATLMGLKLKLWALKASEKYHYLLSQWFCSKPVNCCYHQMWRVGTWDY